MLSIVYITFREHCKFEWFIDSLVKQSDSSLRKNIQIIIVDGFLFEGNYQRKEYISSTINNQFEFVHVEPKPTPWQGRHRITDFNYFAAANTRNTGACYAKYDYIAFHDDLGVPNQTWLKAVLDAKDAHQIHCGAYTKSNDMVVENGILISKKDNGVDTRFPYYTDLISICMEGHLYGSSFCMPINVYFELNGINEMCDGCGGEDYELGIRLTRKGYKYYYNKLMFIYESEDFFGSDKNRTCIRCDPKKNENDPISDLSHYMLNYSKNGPLAVNSKFSLKEYNHKITHLKLDPDTVFIKPDPNEIHFFTNNLISNGLVMKTKDNFNWEIYIQKYPDLCKAGINTADKAWNHYQRFGINENRNDF